MGATLKNIRRVSACLSDTRLSRLGAVSAVALWGVSFVATKAALQETSPVTIVFSRFALGIAALVVILRIRRQPLLPPREMWPVLVLMGLIVLAGVFVVQRAPAGETRGDQG